MIERRIFSLVMMTSQLWRTHHCRCENNGHQTSEIYQANDMLFCEAFDYDKGINYYTVELQCHFFYFLNSFIAHCFAEMFVRTLAGFGCWRVCAPRGDQEGQRPSGQVSGLRAPLCAAKAYKKLSLLYHPDKTSGLTKEERPTCRLWWLW